MEKIASCGRSIGTIKLSAAMFGLALALATSVGSAFAEQTISGTYAVKFERACVKGPYRLTPEPAFFSYSTPDNTPNGYVVGPAGVPNAGNMVSRSDEAGSYLMVVNPINNTITMTGGTYRTIPVPGYNLATGRVALADFGTFTGSGSFVSTRHSSHIDTDVQTFALGGDGVSNSLTTNMKVRYETRDKGENFYSVIGRGSIRLQHNTPANVYRDVHCTGVTTGTRISRAY